MKVRRKCTGRISDTTLSNRKSFSILDLCVCQYLFYFNRNATVGTLPPKQAPTPHPLSQVTTSHPTPPPFPGNNSPPHSTTFPKRYICTFRKKPIQLKLVANGWNEWLVTCFLSQISQPLQKFTQPPYKFTATHLYS